MKFNVFGKRAETIEMNLMRAILCEEQGIGFPNARIPEALNIMEKALTPDEIELLRMGYGIGVDRKMQNEIALELGLSDSEVSRKAWAAIAKLRKSPYKVELKSLVPTIEELNSFVDQAQKVNELRKEVNELNHRLEVATSLVAEKDSENLQLKEQLAKLEYSYSCIGKELEAEKAESGHLRDKNLGLTSELRMEKEKARLLLMAFDEATKRLGIFEEASKAVSTRGSVQELRGEIARQIAAMAIEELTIEELNIPAESVARLKRAGIKTISDACRNKRRNLVRLLGKEVVDELAVELKKLGLAFMA